MPRPAPVTTATRPAKLCSSATGPSLKAVGPVVPVVSTQAEAAEAPTGAW